MNIGKYEVISLLGKGGMSEVYEVLDPKLGSRRALKIYNYPKDDPVVKQRFEAEGRLLAKLSHPGIVKVFDIGTDGDKPYFTMELVLSPEGKATCLSDVPEGSADEEQIGRWYDDLRDTLAYIHGQGIIHRDLKLQNIMIGADGRAILADFGISKIFDKEKSAADGINAVNTLVKIRDGNTPVMGSLGYMAPELEMGAEATAKTDWYALGVIVYKLLTGTWCDSRTDIIPTLETYDPAWMEILPKLLHTNPEGRECAGWAETKQILREKAEAKAEARLTKEKQRAKRARHYARAAAFAALAISVATTVTSIKFLQTRKRLKETEIRLLYPTFDKIFKIPGAIPDNSVSDGQDQNALSDWKLCQIDAWFLVHGYFESLGEGKISFNELNEALKVINKQVQKGEADDLWGDDYNEQGEEDTLKEMFSLAMKRMVKSAKKLHSRGLGDATLAPESDNSEQNEKARKQ